MHVQNISFQINPEVELQWIEWMKNKFIPLLKSTNCFLETPFYQLKISEDQAPTYTLQLFALSLDKLTQFDLEHSPLVMEELQTSWGNQCFHFITNMQIVN
jgi:hypothetical protein